MIGWRSAERILCVRLDALGDVTMTMPAIAALCSAKPHVALLTSHSGSAIAPLFPNLSRVIQYDAPWMKAASDRVDPAYDLQKIEELRKMEFDAAIIFTVFSQNPLPAALLCYLVGIPIRIARCRENPYQLLSHWIQEDEPHERIRHEVARQLDLVASLGVPIHDARIRLTISAAAKETALGYLNAFGRKERPIIIIHPGARAPSRRYPADSFAEVGQSLAERGYAIVITGDAEESAVTSRAKPAHLNAHLVAGKLSTEEFAALIAGADLIITNNSGPAHIAAGVGTPVVDLYALTNPQHTPWMVPSRVLNYDVPCKNCFKSICPLGHNHCLTKVPPSEVVRAAEELLAQTRNRRSSEYHLTATRNVMKLGVKDLSQEVR